MRTRLVSALLSLFAVGLIACENSEPIPPPGFQLVLVDNGEVILSDRHVEAYELEHHRLVLTPEGQKRWETFVHWDTSHQPPIRQLGSLTGRQFSLRIEGQEIYTGHFWSMVMSSIRPGPKIYDTLGAMEGSVSIRHEGISDNSPDDPRDRPEVADYFRSTGRLR